MGSVQHATVKWTDGENLPGDQYKLLVWDKDGNCDHANLFRNEDKWMFEEKWRNGQRKKLKLGMGEGCFGDRCHKCGLMASERGETFV